MNIKSHVSTTCLSEELLGLAKKFADILKIFDMQTMIKKGVKKRGFIAT